MNTGRRRWLRRAAALALTAGPIAHALAAEAFPSRPITMWVPWAAGGATDTAELTLAVASGQVMAGVNSSGFAPEVDAGRLRLLATMGAQRSPRWPQVPTLRELGFDIVAMSPYGLAGPRGLPPEVLAALHDGFKKALFDPRFAEDLARYDQEIAYLGPEDYARACREEYAKERAIAERLKGPRGPGG